MCLDESSRYGPKDASRISTSHNHVAINRQPHGQQRLKFCIQTCAGVLRGLVLFASLYTAWNLRYRKSDCIFKPLVRYLFLVLLLYSTHYVYNALYSASIHPPNSPWFPSSLPPPSTRSPFSPLSPWSPSSRSSSLTRFCTVTLLPHGPSS